MRKRCVSFISLLCLLACLFCSQAFAQISVEDYAEVQGSGATVSDAQGEQEMLASSVQETLDFEEQDESVVEEIQEIPVKGFDIRIALTAPYTMSSGAKFSLKDMEYQFIAGPGFGIEIQAVYRYKKVGFGIEQKLNGIFSMVSEDNEENIENTQPSQEQQTKSLFMGATFLIIKEYVNAGHNGVFTFAEGLGVAYEANSSDNKIFPGKSDYAFAFKFDLGYTYFIKAKYGIGFNLEYMLGVSFHKTSYILGSSAAFVQSFIPKLTYQMIF